MKFLLRFAVVWFALAVCLRAHSASANEPAKKDKPADANAPAEDEAAKNKAAAGAAAEDRKALAEKRAAQLQAAKQQAQAARGGERNPLGDGLTEFGRMVFGGGAVPAAAPVPKAAERVDQPAVELDEDMVKAQQQQFATQYQPLLIAELGTIRLLFPDLTPAQRTPIRAAGEGAVQDVARKMAEYQFKNQDLQMRAGKLTRMAYLSNAPPRPFESINAALAEAIEETVGADAVARYRAETTKQQDQHKRAAIATAVAVLDTRLHLSAEQRSAISKGLEAKWQPDFESWLMFSRYNAQSTYVPTMPDDVVVPHLTVNQTKIWHGLQRVSFGVHTNGNVRPDDDWWGAWPGPDGQAQEGQIIRGVFRAN